MTISLAVGKEEGLAFVILLTFATVGGGIILFVIETAAIE
jgi:hypothetical protein